MRASASRLPRNSYAGADLFSARGSIVDDTAATIPSCRSRKTRRGPSGRLFDAFRFTKKTSFHGTAHRRGPETIFELPRTPRPRDLSLAGWIATARGAAVPVESPLGIRNPSGPFSIVEKIPWNRSSVPYEIIVLFVAVRSSFARKRLGWKYFHP